MAWCYLMDANPLPSLNAQLSRRTMLGGLAALAAGATGAQVLRPSTARAAVTTTRTWAELLVPGYGAWFGAYPGPGNAAPAPYESMVGRKLDVVSRYEALDGAWPSPADLQLMKEGRYLAVCWSSRLKSGGVATWKDVAAGRHDAAIRAQAHRLASLGPLWVGYDNEMDGHVRIANSGPLSYYRPAFRRIHSIVAPIAPNVIWIWCPTGNNMNAAVAAAYPGDGQVDWICFDPYDPVLAKGGPLSAYRTFPNWLKNQGIGVHKPKGIFETGFQRAMDETPAAAAWMAEVPAALETLDIRMWIWFNSYGGLGDTSIAPGSRAASALGTVGARGIMRRPHKRP